VHPGRNRNLPLTGVFASRSPDRPNPLGLHRVTVREMVGTRLKVGPLEALDGTPVVDIKSVLRLSADSERDKRGHPLTRDMSHVINPIGVVYSQEQLINLVRDGIVTPCVSVTLVLEYEEVLIRQKKILQVTQEDIKTYLGFLVSQSERIKIYYLWRPHLKDPKDDMVLEVAVSAGVEFIVTHNIKDFKGSEQFGIQVVTPGWFVKNIGGMK